VEPIVHGGTMLPQNKKQTTNFLLFSTYHQYNIMSLSTSVSSISPIMALTDAFAETSYVLQRTSLAGAFGLGLGPLLLSRRTVLPMWRVSMLGASALASLSLPFICMERLSYYAITTSTPVIRTVTSVQQKNDTKRKALYASHAMGTVLGAGLVRASVSAGVIRAPKYAKGPLRIPVNVLFFMLCKAHVEGVLLDQQGK
jgi:hypothetical protein